VPRLCEFYSGICLTTEEKARINLSQVKKTLSQDTKNLCQDKKNLSQSTVYILPKHPHITKPTQTCLCILSTLAPGPTQPPVQWLLRALSQRKSVRRVNLRTRMNGDIPPALQYAFLVCTQTAVPVPLHSELILYYWQMTKSSKQQRKQQRHQYLL
jgi:hypothetical protein